jgi:hypothetical protein
MENLSFKDAEDEIIEFIQNLSIKKFHKYQDEYREETGHESLIDTEDSESYETAFLAWIFVNKMNRE